MKVKPENRSYVEKHIGLNTLSLKTVLNKEKFLTLTQANNCIKNVKKRLKCYNYTKANVPKSQRKKHDSNA